MWQMDNLCVLKKLKKALNFNFIKFEPTEQQQVISLVHLGYEPAFFVGMRNALFCHRIYILESDDARNLGEEKKKKKQKIIPRGGL